MLEKMHVAAIIVERDLMLLRQRFCSLLIDGLILVVTQTVVIGKLFPMLGMPKNFVAPIFIGGSTILTLISLGYYKAMDIVNNIAYKEAGETGFHFILPTSPGWVLSAYIVSFVIEALIIITPLIFAGMIVLNEEVFTSLSVDANWFAFLLIHILGIVMTGVFFLFAAFTYPVSWFMNNIWTRRIHIIFWLSANLYTWKQVHEYSSICGYILLCNPVTYYAEGLRSSVLGSADYISPYLCIPVLIATIAFFSWRLKKGVVKSLDPVWER